MENLGSIAEKIHNLIKGYGVEVEKFDANGKRVVDPQGAIRFVVDNPNMLIRLDKDRINLSVQANQPELDEFRQTLKHLASKHWMDFDFKLFNKKLTPKSEEIDIASNIGEDIMNGVMEGFGQMTGSSKTSYQPLENVKIVVKHRAPVNEESRGCRSRNIHSIYIQRGEEKFKMAENNLKAARAMARHLNMGGEVFDTVGTSIVEMASEQRKLKEFVRYVNARGLVNETNQEYVSLAKESIGQIKSTLDKLSGIKSYANAVESLAHLSNVEILEDDVDLESQFTETHFDSRVADAMDSIKRGMSRQASYKRSIEEAIAGETFEGLKDSLRESDALEFNTPQSRLSYQVSQLGNVAQNGILKSHLQGISQRLAAGESLGQFDYSTIKSCLLSANEAKVKGSMYESAEQSYADFLEQFDIL